MFDLASEGYMLTQSCSGQGNSSLSHFLYPFMPDNPTLQHPLGNLDTYCHEFTLTQNIWRALGKWRQDHFICCPRKWVLFLDNYTKHTFTPLSEEGGSSGFTILRDNWWQMLSPFRFQTFPHIHAPPPFSACQSQYRPVSLGADLASDSLYEYDPQKGEALSGAPPQVCYHHY